MNPWVILPIVALGVLYVMLPIALPVFLRYRLRKPLRCPVTGERAWVLVDAPHAAISSIVGCHSLKVRSCSLWPARMGCEQGCVDAEIREDQ